MLYRTLFAVAALGLSTLAGAADVPANSDAEADIKMACIVDFVAEELDSQLHDSYINECVQKKIAALKSTTDKKG